MILPYMPELAEVEVNRQSLLKYMEGGQFFKPILYRSDVLRTKPVDLDLSILDAAVLKDITRVGKYLIFHLSSKEEEEYVLIMHFRMTGSFVYRKAIPEDLVYSKHMHLAFPVTDKFKEKAYLIWHDVRRFGTLELMSQDDFTSSTHTIHSLGPDPFNTDCTAAYLKEKAKRHKALSIAQFLLNQSIIAGLGTIYVTEALFACQLHPKMLASKLTRAKFDSLIVSLRHLLTRSIALGGTSFRNYVDTEGSTGQNMKNLKLYGRYKKPCIKCGTTVERETIGGRTFAYCPHCQKLKGKPKMNFFASGYSSRVEFTKTSIRAFTYDPLSGFKALDHQLPKLDDVSYIIFDDSQTKILGVQEASNAHLTSIDLKKIDEAALKITIDGQGPCHLAIWEDFIFTANYGSGTLSILQKQKDEIRNIGDIIHTGSGPNKERQTACHTHWVGITKDERYLVAADLGSDKLYSYLLTDIKAYVENLSIEKKEDALSIKARHESIMPAGSGPRHLVFSKDGKHAYLAAELSCELITLAYNDGQFEIVEIHDVSALKPPAALDPKTAEGDEFVTDDENEASSDEFSTAAIRMTEDDRYVLISVRGSDRLWSFSRDPRSGKLEFRDHKHVGAIWPRDFQILQDGKSIIVACERSNKLTAMLLDTDSGLLKFMKHEVDMAAPSCILT